jgi:hypothetical protein
MLMAVPPFANPTTCEREDYRWLRSPENFLHPNRPEGGNEVEFAGKRGIAQATCEPASELLGEMSPIRAVAIRSFAIATTKPRELCPELHDRMPVVLNHETWPMGRFPLARGVVRGFSRRRPDPPRSSVAGGPCRPALRRSELLAKATRAVFCERQPKRCHPRCLRGKPHHAACAATLSVDDRKLRKPDAVRLPIDRSALWRACQRFSID